MASTSPSETRSESPKTRGDRIRSVTEINKEARFLIEERFGLVWIEGEISNLSRPGSGHWYFSLKDNRAQIRCAMFANRNRFVRATPKNGTTVVVRGRLSLYEARGEFQLIVDHIAPAGEGALKAAFDELVKTLAAEGLFKADTKRPLPAFPRRIAMISSRSGAAPQDVLAVIARRFPAARVTWFWVAVQGDESEGQVLTALDRIDRMRNPPDVVIVTRGGGSLEDLWTFNLESVARRLANLSVPVVSAIGHETDTTICDYIADQRAPTPSAAAELVTPDGQALINHLARVRQMLERRTEHQAQSRQLRLNGASARLVDPGRGIEQRHQRIDELRARLDRSMRASLALKHQRAVQHARLLASDDPRQRIARMSDRLNVSSNRLLSLTTARISNAQGNVAGVARTLQAVSPLATLDRGYAIAATPDDTTWGKPVLTIDAVSAGDPVDVHLHDGTLTTRVVDTTRRLGDGVKPSDGEDIN